MRNRPDVIITTGAHTAVPMCYVAKLFRKKIIFIESYAKSSSPTLSGRLVYPISDLFIVQAGHTKFNSSLMEIHDFVTYQTMDQWFEQSNDIISHAGTGSVLSGQGHIIPCHELKNLKKAVQAVQLFQPKPFISGKEKICTLLETYIEQA